MAIGLPKLKLRLKPESRLGLSSDAEVDVDASQIVIQSGLIIPLHSFIGEGTEGCRRRGAGSQGLTKEDKVKVKSLEQGGPASEGQSLDFTHSSLIPTPRCQNALGELPFQMGSIPSQGRQGSVQYSERQDCL